MLFVSHNMAAIENLCPRAVLMRRGNVAFDGIAADCTGRYAATGTPTEASEPRMPGAAITRVRLLDRGGQCRSSLRSGEGMLVAVDLRPTSRLSHVRVGIGINDTTGQRLATLQTHYTGFEIDSVDENVTVMCEVPEVALAPGEYGFTIAVASGQQSIDQLELPGFLSIVASDYYGHGTLPARTQGPFLMKHTWRSSRQDESASERAPDVNSAMV